MKRTTGGSVQLSLGLPVSLKSACLLILLLVRVSCRVLCLPVDQPLAGLEELELCPCVWVRVGSHGVREAGTLDATSVIKEVGTLIA